MTTNRYIELADILKVLGHPVRIRIIESLLDQDKCVSHLGGSLELRQSTVSQHLSLLRTKGIVKDERCGSTVKYSVRDQRIGEIMKLLKHA
jgi:DNA-binding transcriptional ArsR family regulator